MRALLLALLFASAAQAQDAATYRVTFESTWSAETHPDDFPPDPHFSGLVGGTHNATARLWEPGALASPGIERMAETGSKTLLMDEVAALIGAGQAGAVLSGGGIPLSPGTVSLTFEVTEAFAHVSLVSMLAPSPDWFVGVAALHLREGGAWVSEEVVPLHVYDAGTDSGTTYTAPDADTDPPEPIALIEGPPFLVDGVVPPVGQFTFTLLSVSAAEDDAARPAFALDPPVPNPTTHGATVRLHLGAAQPVRVEVFDVLGRRVAVLHDGVLPVGAHPFAVGTGALGRGMYVVRARSAGTTVSRRLTVQ
ncbi:MAG: spondin domain-containing protein [Rhodothermales bacterium]|nr:spondin domain-containing protein [Rhodothermales bacterium]